MARPEGVNRLVNVPRLLRFKTQNRSWPPGRTPLVLEAIRLRERKLIEARSKSKNFLGSWGLSEGRKWLPNREGGV